MFNILDRHLNNTMKQWPDSLMFKGANAPCSAISLSARELSNVLDLFGESYKTSVQLRIADFSEASPPKIGDLVSYRNQELRVLSRKTSTDHNELRLDLGDKYAS